MPSDAVMRILGYAIKIPPQKDVSTFPKETLQRLLENIEQRFSPNGRMQYARFVCQDLHKYGFMVPDVRDPNDLQFYTETECVDELMTLDEELFTDEMVDETRDYLQKCLHPHTPDTTPTPAH